MAISIEQWEASHTQGVGITNVQPASLIALGTASVFILALDRGKALIAFLCAALLIFSYQKIAISGVNFFLPRILILIGLCRLFFRSEFYPARRNSIDHTMLLYVLVLSVANILLWQNMATTIYRVGQVIDVLGGYILLRSFIRDMKDIDRVIRLFVVISAIIAVSMLIEYATTNNLFSILGADQVSPVRDGRTRCSGPFTHPILAGTFGALMFPLFVYLWVRGSRTFSVIGMISSLAIIFAASSSTPVFSFLASLIGLSMFPFRKKMRIIRWGLALVIISLHLIMKAPVWALIARISAYDSSTSYRRYLMIDQFINRFPEWFLVGTKSTANWGHESEQMFDVTNGYVQTGVDGGILSLLLLITLIVFCFSSVGKAMITFDNHNNEKFLIWTIGVMLFTHLVAFNGVSYFGQMIVVWIVTIIMISTLKDLSSRKNNSDDLKTQ
jgi:hypothetical protein